MNNPFSLTFGIEPNNFIQRISETDRIVSEFSSELAANRVYLITGLRGSGKTVLLSSIAKELSGREEWVVVDPGSKKNILENIASEIYEEGSVKKIFLHGEWSFSFHGLTFSLKGKEEATTVTSLLKKMIRHLNKKGRRVLITIDEIDSGEEMKTFAETYQFFLRSGLDVFLLMTGLYENVSKLQDEKTLTFLYRAPKIFLGPLNLSAIAFSYQKHLSANEKEAMALAKFSKGYAYAYQVLGYLLFNQRKKELDADVLAEFDQYMAEYVYDKLHSELSEKERFLLSFFPDEAKIRIEELRQKSSFDSKSLSVYRDRLIKKGVVYAPQYGYLQLSLPRFAAYLLTK